MGGFEGKVNFWGAVWGCFEARDSRVADVFISYKREDRPRIAIIAELLSDLGLSAWFDASLVSGDTWQSVINREVGQASAMLVCWTPQAVNSVQVMREVLEGVRRRIYAPVLLADCDLPAELNRTHMPNLTDWDLSLDNHEWLALLSRLEVLTNTPGLRAASEERAAGQAAASLMRRILIEAARQGRVLSYKQGVGALQGALREVHRERAPRVTHDFLFGALDATAAENRARREPPLCVSVVNKTGRPGRGYFQKHAFLDDHEDPFAEPIFNRHLERVRSWQWD